MIQERFCVRYVTHMNYPVSILLYMIINRVTSRLGVPICDQVDGIHGTDCFKLVASSLFGPSPLPIAMLKYSIREKSI